MTEDVHMNGTTNAPLAVLTFFAGIGGASVWGILGSLLVATLVGVLGKAVDSFIRTMIAERNNRWRKEAARLAARIKQLEAADGEVFPSPPRRPRHQSGNAPYKRPF